MKLYQGSVLLILAALCLASCKKKEQAESGTLAQISTSPVTGVTDMAAIGGGAIHSDGGSTVTETGICWDTLAGPDLNKGSKSMAASLGNYTCAITGLKPYTQYFVRAYATNAKGTSYGSEISFRCQDIWQVQSIASTTLPGINCMKVLGDKLYAGTNTGIYSSSDGGDTWQASGLQGQDVYSIGLSETKLFAALSNNALYRSDDMGLNWVNTRAALSSPTVMDILISGNSIYRSEYNGIYLSSDNGHNWININPSPGSPYMCSRLLECSNTIYTPSGTYTSLYKTNNAGISWQLSTDLNFGVSPSFLPDIDCLGNILLFSTGKGLYLSTDEGNIWTKCHAIPNTEGFISVSEQFIFWASRSLSEFYTSPNGGTTWYTFNKKGIPSSFMNLSEVVVCKKAIFLYSSVQKTLYKFRR